MSEQTPIELLSRLVAFDTTSSKSNLALIDFVRDHLGGFGIAATTVPSKDAKKASLFATIGPEGDGGIGLSGHSDCVPVEGQNWSSDPFTLTERDGKLYARGSCDMKGFIACVLASVPMLQAAKLRAPIHILISYDEEVGCTGVRPMLALLGSDLPRPSVVIVGEPTSMQVIDAHKRIISYRTSVTGREAHSSMPQLGVNAINASAELIGELKRIAADLEATQNDTRFDPPYSTVFVGTIDGGTAANIVPKNCEFQWQIRALPDMDAEIAERELATFAETKLLPGMQAASKSAAIATERQGSVPAFDAKPDSEAVRLALELTHEHKSHAVSYTTEAGLFEEAGCEAAICGPGDIRQAHAADEFVSIDQLDRCMQFLERLAAKLSA